MFIMLAVVIAFLAAIGGFKFFQIKAMMAQGGWQAPPEAVTTVVATQEEWTTTLNAIGTVAAVQGVTVSVPGFDHVISSDDWYDVIRTIAKQEMGHLITVQNLLLSLGATPHRTLGAAE